jgi:hypothetical protein
VVVFATDEGGFGYESPGHPIRAADGGFVGDGTTP